jgi:large subunit ribosomal protein L18
MPVIKHNKTKAEHRRLRVRAKMSGTQARPRVTVFRSNKYLYIQAIDDASGRTIVATHTKQVKPAKKDSQTKSELAAVAAKKLATDLKTKKITAAIFDRGANKYHGRIKAVAETLRSEGIKV